MARMIPSDVGFFQANSREDEMFLALKKLPDDFYVFHSYRVVEMLDEKLQDNEVDFLVFHPSHGCLLIECKAGKVYRDTEGEWHYRNGDTMKDPFDQVSTGMYMLINKFENMSKSFPRKYKLLKDCKFMYCVWFPSYTSSEIQSKNFGPNVDKQLILTNDDLTNPTNNVLKIMKSFERIHVIFQCVKTIDDSKTYKHKLDKESAKEFFEWFLCPTFDLVKNERKDIEEYKYAQLLKEQVSVLNFLSEQKTAAISGASGTGKTMIALERARRVASDDSKVLFLCFNKNLKDFLAANYPIKNVDFFTIDGFACSMTNSSEANMDALWFVLNEQIEAKKFPYKHIIVDECQDFGSDTINRSHILNTFNDYAQDGDGRSFFTFYDKNQLVNVDKLPDYLINADSKITLYQNCRNTKKIADTAYELIKIKPKTYNKALEGDFPRFRFYKDVEDLKKKLNSFIDKLESDSPEYSRVLITCSEGEKYSILYPHLNQKNKSYKTANNHSCKFYSSSTFKGLEADHVILIDCGKDLFDPSNKKFYIAATRAKKTLTVFSNLTLEEANEILDTNFSDAYLEGDNAYENLALAMHGVYVK